MRRCCLGGGGEEKLLEIQCNRKNQRAREQHREMKHEQKERRDSPQGAPRCARRSPGGKEKEFLKMSDEILLELHYSPDSRDPRSTCLGEWGEWQRLTPRCRLATF